MQSVKHHTSFVFRSHPLFADSVFLQNLENGLLDGLCPESIAIVVRMDSPLRSEATASSDARPGRVFERSENTERRKGRPALQSNDGMPHRGCRLSRLGVQATFLYKKSPASFDVGDSYKKVAATYSPTWWGSTIGDGELNFSVRNGKRGILTAITATICF